MGVVLLLPVNGEKRKGGGEGERGRGGE